MTGLVPVTVITGAVVSTTLTVLVAVDVLPEGSVPVYVIVYVPTTSVFTVPEEETATAPPRSEPVAPASVYEAPNSTVAGLSPVTDMTGAVVSTTFTVLVVVPTFAQSSIAVYVSVYVPTTFVLTVPVTTTGSPVSAVAPASIYALPSSTTVGLFPLRVITGGVESLSSSPKRLSRTTPEAPTAKIFSIIFNSTHMRFRLSPIFLMPIGSSPSEPVSYASSC